jgi:hypothetical protein
MVVVTRPAWTRVLTGAFALAAAAVYVAASALGSVLDPTYSQVRQHVSDLTASGASTWSSLAPLYLLYNALVAAFAIALYNFAFDGWPLRVGTGLLLTNALTGVLMITAFREDPGGVPTTVAGSGHLVVAGVSSVAILVGSFVFCVAFNRSPIWKPLARFSGAVGVGFAILGPIAAFATATKSDLAGLAERGPIGLFIVWLVVVGLFAVFHASSGSAPRALVGG